MADTREGIYFERQSLQLCGVHALNSLLQQEAFSKKRLDGIAKGLAGEVEAPRRFRRSRHHGRLGNYDINVLMVALAEEGYDTKWHDARKPIAPELDSLPLAPEGGLLINIRIKKKLFGSSRHWLALVALQGGDEREWYNLDSKRKKPFRFRDQDHVDAMIMRALGKQDAQVFIVSRKNEEEGGREEGGGEEGGEESSSSSTSSSSDSMSSSTVSITSEYA